MKRAKLSQQQSLSTWISTGKCSSTAKADGIDSGSNTVQAVGHIEVDGRSVVIFGFNVAVNN